MNRAAVRHRKESANIGGATEMKRGTLPADRQPILQTRNRRCSVADGKIAADINPPTIFNIQRVIAVTSNIQRAAYVEAGAAARHLQQGAFTLHRTDKNVCGVELSTGGQNQCSAMNTEIAAERFSRAGQSPCAAVTLLQRVEPLKSPFKTSQFELSRTASAEDQRVLGARTRNHLAVEGVTRSEDQRIVAAGKRNCIGVGTVLIDTAGNRTGVEQRRVAGREIDPDPRGSVLPIRALVPPGWRIEGS